MKITKQMSVVFSGLFAIASAPSSKPYLTTDSMVGPFNISENATIEFHSHNMKSTYFFFITYYYVGQDGYIIKQRLRAGDISDGEGMLNYTFQFKDRLIDKGLKIIIEIGETSSSSSVISSQTVYVYPFVEKQSINARNYTKEDFVLPQYTFHFLDSGEVINEERISFKNTIDYLSNNSDNELDISELSFFYNENLLNGSEQYLYIEDLNNDFPYIDKDSKGYFRVPLELTQTGQDVYLSFKDNLYYKPDSLEMSLTPRGGFKLTDKFFLPVDIDEAFEENDMYVSISNFGYCQTDIKIPLRFYLEKSYLGLCDLSNFCIKGGMKG